MASAWGAVWFELCCLYHFRFNTHPPGKRTRPIPSWYKSNWSDSQKDIHQIIITRGGKRKKVTNHYYDSLWIFWDSELIDDQNKISQHQSGFSNDSCMPKTDFICMVTYLSGVMRTIGFDPAVWKCTCTRDIISVRTRPVSLLSWQHLSFLKRKTTTRAHCLCICLITTSLSF